jgi:type III secretory pathway lipoprotein EscJ
MDELAKNKIRYILLRYKVDSKDLNVTLRLELLKRWIKSCVESEEYEMASILKEKRNELLRAIRRARTGERHLFDDWIIKLKWVFRKFKRKLFRL